MHHHSLPDEGCRRGRASGVEQRFGPRDRMCLLPPPSLPFPGRRLPSRVERLCGGGACALLSMDIRRSIAWQWGAPLEQVRTWLLLVTNMDEVAIALSGFGHRVACPLMPLNVATTCVVSWYALLLGVATNLSPPPHAWKTNPFQTRFVCPGILER